MIITGVAAWKFGEIVGNLSKKEDFIPNSILVAENFYPEDTPIMLKSRAIISLFGGMLSHAAIVSREFEIPCIMGVADHTPKKLVDLFLSHADSGKKIQMSDTGKIILLDVYSQL